MSELEQPQAPSAGQPSRLILDDRERTTMQRYLASTGNFPPEFVSWMEEYMRTLLTAGNLTGLAQRVATVGEYKLIAKDLTAQTGLYVWEDAQGAWLYCNGASIAGAGYTELEAFIGGTTLPDTLGRAAWACGTHADVDLFDNDGVAQSSRRPAHGHSNNFVLSGAPGVGTLALPNHGHSVTDPGHAHTLSGGSNVNAPSAPPRFQGTTAGEAATPSTNSATTGISVGNPTSLPAITGAPSAGTLAVSGSVGLLAMQASDQVAFVVLGSWLIKA